MLVLRLAVGLGMAAHGAQKLFGAFGGRGPAGTAQMMEGLGFHPGRRAAYAAGCTELGGGLFLAAGSFTPLDGAAVIGVMIVAVAAVTGRNGASLRLPSRGRARGTTAV
jgi:putative oxidoreductase